VRFLYCRQLKASSYQFNNLYTGSIGYIAYNGDADLNIVIRTVLCQGKDAWFQVGGGIVWDSDPQLEYEECLHKAKGQIMALSM